jgi:hypothetical protein
MNSSICVVAACFVLAATLVAAAGAQDTPSGVIDRGRLITLQGDVPIATERFEYLRQGDSLVINATAQRRLRQPGGSYKLYSKSMVLSARADDFGMLNYISNETLDSMTVVRSILPNDTMLTVYTEVRGGHGGADYVERPLGRFFAMDKGLFTLFDVIGRNLQHRIFGSRPVQLVMLGETARGVEATATLAGVDTVAWGGRRVVTERIVLSDSTSTFTLWVSPEGHMLRLEGLNGKLVVVREPPAPAKRPRARTR